MILDTCESVCEVRHVLDALSNYHRFVKTTPKPNATKNNKGLDEAGPPPPPPPESEGLGEAVAEEVAVEEMTELRVDDIVEGVRPQGASLLGRKAWTAQLRAPRRCADDGWDIQALKRST